MPKHQAPDTKNASSKRVRATVDAIQSLFDEEDISPSQMENQDTQMELEVEAVANEPQTTPESKPPVVTPDAPHKEPHELKRTDDAEAARNLLDEFEKSSADNDALALAMIAQEQKPEEKPAEKDSKPASIFDAAVEFDIENHQNLHFSNPRVESAKITFDRSQSKKDQKWWENIRVKFQDERDRQRWDGKVQFNATFISPPGLIELANLPPFGNMSELNGGRKLDPKKYTDCKASLIYTSKFFGVAGDRDDIEYQKRTKKAYIKKMEDQRYDQYMRDNPDAKEVPESAYAWHQDTPLTDEQMKELPEFERFSYNSFAVNSFVHRYEELVETMYFDQVKRNPEKTAPSLKASVEKAIADELKERQDKEDKLADEEKRRSKRLEALPFDTELRRRLKSKIKREQGGVATLKFSKNLFEEANTPDKLKKLETLVPPHSEIGRICKENKLLPITLDVFRLSTPQQLAANPDLEPLQRMSVAEAYQLITEDNKGTFIGQVVFNTSPNLISGNQYMVGKPLAVIFWAPARAFRPLRVFGQRDDPPPPVMKRVIAPIPESSSAQVDVAKFASMGVPKALSYQKKEEKKEEKKDN